MLKNPLIRLAAVALTLGTLLLPGFASADGPSPLSSPNLSTPAAGTLGLAQSAWYQFAGDGSSPIGVTLDYAAGDGSHPANVFFYVDWGVADGALNADWPGLYRNDHSTAYGLPPGTQYWSRSTSAKTNYYVEVVNNSGFPVAYGIGLTGSAFPPPALSMTPSSSGQPLVVPTPPPPAPVPTATPAPTAAGNTVTVRSGLILDPVVQVNDVFSTVFVKVDSSSTSAAAVYRIMIRPPDGAVVDASIPNESISEDGIVWYLSQVVTQGNPLSGYYVRVYGPANGTVVEADWATSKDKGALSVTISGAPNPAPIGSQ